MRLRDMASVVRTTDPDDPVLRIVLAHMQALRTAATAVVLNTFGELEGEVVAAMSAVLPPIYTVGPLPLLTEEQCKAAAAGSPLETLSANLTKGDDGSLYHDLLLPTLFIVGKGYIFRQIASRERFRRQFRNSRARSSRRNFCRQLIEFPTLLV
jgi:hypothetical protein